MKINRRRFLQVSVGCASPLILGLAGGRRLWAAGFANQPVVVVGAGLAGLRAADVLRKAGRQVVVLEARSFPGGRVQTIRAPFGSGQYADAGPVRIAGGSHKTVLRLARQYGLRLVPFDSSSGSPLMRIGGVNIRSETFDGARVPLKLKPEEEKLRPNELFKRYVGNIPDDLANPDLAPASYGRWAAIDQVTWPNRLRSRGASDDAVKLMTLGGDSSELSALYVLRQIALLQGATFFKIQGGMDLLPLAMVSSMRDIVRYNASVVRMDQRHDPVRVDYLENGQMKSLRASRVILTTPLTTLRRIEVHPPFSREKTRVIEGLPYFPATRFLLQSRNRFWQNSHLSGYARTDQPAEIWDCTYDLKGDPGILGVTVGGALGRKIQDLDPQTNVAFGTDLVAAVFPPIRSEYQKGVAKLWALEPWSRGAFAVFHPGQMISMMPDLARPEGRVHFAGEHTSSWSGWMEGALISGERAAREILNGVN